MSLQVFLRYEQLSSHRQIHRYAGNGQHECSWLLGPSRKPGLSGYAHAVNTLRVTYYYSAAAGNSANFGFIVIWR
nr:hypothetical protein [uncultured Pseudomonas sp.]